MIINELFSKIMVNVENKYNDALVFTTIEGKKYQFSHYQDCCENVSIHDINGNLQDLIGEPLTLAEEVENTPQEDLPNEESYTWTFYRFATIKGYVDVRWLGTSNGCYSESVDFEEIK